MSKKPKILIAIPAYNCESQIGRVIAQLTPDVAEHIDKAIVINNQSPDKTEETAIEAFKKVKGIETAVLRNDDNLGYGGSLKVAIQTARKEKFDWLIILHGDDQGSIQDLMPYLKSNEYQNYDCFLGARFQPGSQLQGYSAFRTFGNKVFNLIFSTVLMRRLYDLGSGLNLYRVSIFENDYYTQYPDNLTFDYCGLMAHIFYKRRIRFFPISWREDDQVSNVNLVSQAIFSLKLLARFSLLREKFFSTELREKPRDAYTSSVVYSSVKKTKKEAS